MTAFYRFRGNRTGTLESEFCMGSQIHIDNLPYKGFVLVISCMKE